MKIVLMTAGGSIEPDLPADFLSQKTEYGIDTVVACDRGYEALAALGVTPNVVIGDFDSVSTELRENILSKDSRELPERGISGLETDNRMETYLSSCEVIRLNPEKDDTDTEAAIALCIERGAEKIYLFGATGSRVDHMLGNIELLAYAADRGCELVILDRHNRIRLATQPLTVTKAGQWGSFISLIPYSPVVEKLTLRGFKYEVTDLDIKKGNTLGISNEITAETADISFVSGKLLVIESSD